LEELEQRDRKARCEEARQKLGLDPQAAVEQGRL
jgi:hypothetical protein